MLAPMRARTLGFRFASDLAAPAEVLWAHATSPAGVNRELFPLARMTFPRQAERLAFDAQHLGRRLFRSWILLLGVLPVDYDDLTLLRVTPGVEFVEVSPMLSQREWQHQRTLAPVAGGTRLADTVRFVPRLAALGRPYRLVFRQAFALRHRNLRRMFGVVERGA
jgi:ligand-binding SRPBCC domain-containing protein